jgi:NAD-dependent SIR2 family protein deacetylase
MIIAGSLLVVRPVAGLPLNAFPNGGRLVLINKMLTYLN